MEDTRGDCKGSKGLVFQAFLKVSRLYWSNAMLLRNFKEVSGIIIIVFFGDH